MGLIWYKYNKLFITNFCSSFTMAYCTSFVGPMNQFKQTSTVNFTTITQNLNKVSWSQGCFYSLVELIHNISKS